MRRWSVSSSETLLARIAAEQHGVFSIGQAHELGFDPSTIRKRAHRGMYVRLHRGVYAVAGAPTTWRREAAGLVQSVPALAAASHKTAAYLWELSTREPVRAEVVTVRHRRVIRDDPQIHESVDLEERDVVVLDGLPTTTAVRTIVDLGASASPGYVEHCLDTGLRMGLFTVDDVARFVDRVAKSGRNGIGTIRPLIEERLDWTLATESALEDLFVRIVAASGLPLPDAQFVVTDGGYFVCRSDFAYPDARMLIELDSEQFHMDRVTFQKDRRKQNAALALGWSVYRFTWRQLQDHPAEVISMISRALSAS